MLLGSVRLLDADAAAGILIQKVAGQDNSKNSADEAAAAAQISKAYMYTSNKGKALSIV